MHHLSLAKATTAALYILALKTLGLKLTKMAIPFKKTYGMEFS